MSFVDAASARERVRQLSGRLHAGDAVPFRAPPPEPTTCCGRGCNGCVWEGYFAAVTWWCEEAEALLATAERHIVTTGTN